MAGDAAEVQQPLNSNGPLLNMLIAAIGTVICLGPLLSLDGGTEHILQDSLLETSVRSPSIISSLVGLIICTIPMIADLILDMLSKEKTFAVVQDALSRIFITVVVLGVTSTLLTVSSTVSTRKVLVGMACTKILISSGFITRICLFDQKIFPVRMTCFMSAVVIVNAGLRLYTATTQRSRANETACIASSALLLVFSFMLFVQFIVNFIRKFRSKGYEKLAPHDGISLAFVVTYVVFVMGDVIVTYSHGLYSGLLTDASPGCLSSIIYILAGSMISMNIAEGRHVRAMIVDAKNTLIAAKKAYVRYISHEIRTPLNAAFLGLKLIIDDVANSHHPEDHGRHETLKEIHCACDEAINVLNELLTFDKLESGLLTLNKQELPARNFVLKCVQMFSIQAREKGVELQVVNGDYSSSSTVQCVSHPSGITRSIAGGDGDRPSDKDRNESASARLNRNGSAKMNRAGSAKLNRNDSAKLNRNSSAKSFSVRSVRTVKPTDECVMPLHPADILHADKQKIEQVLRNLVSNALKFTPEGGKVTVVMKFVPDSEEELKRAAELQRQNVTLLKQAMYWLKRDRAGSKSNEPSAHISNRKPSSNNNVSNNNNNVSDDDESSPRSAGMSRAGSGLFHRSFRVRPAPPPPAPAPAPPTAQEERKEGNFEEKKEESKVEENKKEDGNPTATATRTRTQGQVQDAATIVVPSNKNNLNASNHRPGPRSRNQDGYDSYNRLLSSIGPDGGGSSTKSTATVSGRFVVEVIDTGAGLKREDRKRLFKEIVQFNPEKLQGGGGSGFGLYITKGIVDLHKGNINVFSDGEGKGCTFRLEIPMRKSNFFNSGDSAMPRNADSMEFLPLRSGHGNERMGIGMGVGGQSAQGMPQQSLLHPIEEDAPDSSMHMPRSVTANGRVASMVNVRAAERAATANARGETNSSSTMDGNALPSGQRSPMTGSDQRSPMSASEPNSFRSSVAGNPHRGRLLIVDDSKMNRKMVIKIMKARGFACDEAEDGKKGLKMLLANLAMTASAPVVTSPGNNANDRENEREGMAKCDKGANVNEGKDDDDDLGKQQSFHNTSRLPAMDDSNKEKDNADHCSDVDAGENKEISARSVNNNNNNANTNGSDKNNCINDAARVDDINVNNNNNAAAPPPVIDWSKRPYDAVLMDYQMPNMDGPASTKAMRAAGYQGLILGVTGNGMQADIDAFMEAGANKVLVKPFDVSAFEEELKKQQPE